MEWLREVATYLWNFRYLPMKYRWPLIKLRRRLFPSQSPLGLRRSIRYAGSLTNPPLQSPSLFVLGLLWPFPAWRFPATLPLPPRCIAADPKPVRLGAHDLEFLRIMPLWRSRDTPQRALYRIYEAVCAGDGNLIATELQYFWGQSSPAWATVNISDPGCGGGGDGDDDDAEQYAVMAATTETLVESFNWRLEMGLRRTDSGDTNVYEDPPPAAREVCPAWTATVPALTERLFLAPDTTYVESPFHRRNVFVPTGDFYSV